MRSNISKSILDEVEEFIKSKQISYEKNEKFTGQSGNIWKPHFHTNHPKRETFIYVLSTGNSGTASGISNRVVTAWYDLRYLKTERELLRFVSLFDDSTSVWTQEDFRLLQLDGLSELSFWSNKEEFASKLMS